MRGGRGHTVKEHKRFGVVSVKIAANPNTLTIAAARNNNSMIQHSVTPRGAVLYGSLCNPCVIQRGELQLTYCWIDVQNLFFYCSSFAIIRISCASAGRNCSY
jgi:hypothetical protein